jgi:hypothetical protein
VRNSTWRPELTSVAKLGDELWIGVKCQSNVEIAGSPRNSSRASLADESAGGRALDGQGGAIRLPTPIKPQMPVDGTQESDGGG